MLTISIGLVLSLAGCGGGGDDEPTAQITTGTGFYVDSAVSGVNYTCGASEGTTDEAGKFTFEVDKGCTFFLGDIKLRDIDKEILKDGVTVYETDAATAQILQSLDSDGNSTNGITISDEFVTALSIANITTLPTTEAETTAMLEVIENAGGTIISLVDAQGHALSTFISDRDVYAVSEDGFNEDGIGPYRFNSDGSISGSSDSDTWRVDGDKLYFGTGTDFSQYISTNEEYSIFHDDGDSNEITRVYTDKTKAEAYLATLSENSSTSNEYTVFAGNTSFGGGFRNMPADFIELGKGTGTTTFNGSYKYYVIANKTSSTIFIDAAEGSNGEFYGTNTTSNTMTDSGDTWPNLTGAPDGVYVSLGAPEGYALINASNDALSSLTVHGK